MAFLCTCLRTFMLVAEKKHGRWGSDSDAGDLDQRRNVTVLKNENIQYFYSWKIWRLYIIVNKNVLDCTLYMGNLLSRLFSHNFLVFYWIYEAVHVLIPLMVIWETFASL